MSALSKKQLDFCIYYLKDFSGKNAAKKAGYYPSYGYTLLQNPRIVSKIKEYKQCLTNEAFLEAKDVLDLYVRIAFSNINDFIDFGQDEKGKPFVTFKNSGEIDGQIVEEVSCSASGGKIKLCDKFKAMEKLEKYFDLYGTLQGKDNNIINVITGVTRNEV